MQLPRSIKTDRYRSHWVYRILSTSVGIKIAQVKIPEKFEHSQLRLLEQSSFKKISMDMSSAGLV